MRYLLDTCLLSEVWKPKPNQGVVHWLRGAAEDDLFLSVLSLGEIKKGIERLPDGKKKTSLVRDYALLKKRFSDRVLAVTDEIAECWGELSGSAARGGHHLHVVDGLIAATALVSGLTVVTRNTGDFSMTRVSLLDPWT